MAYDEGLAERIRTELADRTDITEKAMFGGLSFLLSGNMSVGVIKDELIVRADPDHYETLVEQPHARPMDFTGRPMRGWLFIAPEGLSEDTELRAWVQHAVTFAASLPPK